MPTYADILISDTHVGHKAGLIYPDPNSEYRPNKTQQWLFACWQQFLDDVEGLLKKYKVDYVHSTWNGDMGDLDYKDRGRSEYWADEADDVSNNTAELFDPLAKMCDDIHVVMGNDAHVGKDGTLDNKIAKDFDNVVPFDKARNKYAHPSVDYKLGDFLINVVHKGANKTRWTDVNGLSALSKMVLLDRTQDNIQVPDIIVRSHFHWSGQLRDIRPHPIAVASWQAKSDFIRYIDTVDSTPKVGGHLVIIRDDELLYSEPLLYTFKRKRAWSPKLKD